jgi:hypothetical protein
VVNSDAYSIIKALMEKELLVIQHQGLVEWLDRLQSNGEISEEEINDLLRRAEQLEIYDLPRSEFISIEALPILEGVQDHSLLHKFLVQMQIAPEASCRDSRISTGILRYFINSYLGYWVVNSTILGLGLSVTV